MSTTNTTKQNFCGRRASGFNQNIKRQSGFICNEVKLQQRKQSSNVDPQQLTINSTQRFSYHNHCTDRTQKTSY